MLMLMLLLMLMLMLLVDVYGVYDVLVELVLDIDVMFMQTWVLVVVFDANDDVDVVFRIDIHGDVGVGVHADVDLDVDLEVDVVVGVGVVGDIGVDV